MKRPNTSAHTITYAYKPVGEPSIIDRGRVTMRLHLAAARWPPRSEPANNHDGAFGYAAKVRLGATSSSTAILNQMNTKTSTACVSGVIVYTIAFRLVSNAATRALLAACATDSSKAFTASDGAALYNTFQAIGREISQLRVAG